MDSKNRIYAVNGNLTEEDLLDLGRLLLKGGLIVKKGKQKLDNKNVKYIEYWIGLEVAE